MEGVALGHEVKRSPAPEGEGLLAEHLVTGSALELAVLVEAVQMVELCGKCRLGYQSNHAQMTLQPGWYFSRFRISFPDVFRIVMTPR
jgi:hypothetical protein